RLSEPEVAEADGAERDEALEDGSLVDEELHRLVDGELQDVVDALVLVRHLHDLVVEALAAALVAQHLDVGEELHVDRDRAGALARVAAAAGGVEGEVPGGDAVQLRERGLGEKLADLVP